MIVRKLSVFEGFAGSLIHRTFANKFASNFYSNPFYYNIGNTLTADGIDFIYAQTNDAFGTAWSGKVNRNTQS